MEDKLAARSCELERARKRIARLSGRRATSGATVNGHLNGTPLKVPSPLPPPFTITHSISPRDIILADGTREPSGPLPCDNGESPTLRNPCELNGDVDNGGESPPQLEHSITPEGAIRQYSDLSEQEQPSVYGSDNESEGSQGSDLSNFDDD